MENGHIAFADAGAGAAARHAERLFELALDLLVVIGFDTRIRCVNAAALPLLGYREEEVVGRPIFDFLHPEDHAACAAEVAAVIGGRPSQGFPLRCLTKTGEVRRFSWNTTAHAGEGVLYAVGRDCTAQHAAEERVRRLARAVEASGDAIVITDPQARITYVNPAFTCLTGWTAEEALGQNPRVLKSGRQGAEFYQEMWRALAAGETWSGKVQNRRKPRPVGGQPRTLDDPPLPDEIYWAHLTISPVRDGDGRIAAYVAVQRDVTAEHQRARRRELARSYAAARADIALLMQQRRPLRQRFAAALERLRQVEQLGPAPFAALFIPTQGPASLRLVAWAGEPPGGTLPCGGRPFLHGCLCEQAAERNESLSVLPARPTPGVLCQSRDPARGFFAASVPCGGRRRGALLLGSRCWGDAASHRGFLRTVGQILGQAVAAERQQRKLRRARQAAEQASQAKSAFLANVSHELRTPLTAILGFADVLVEGLAQPQWQAAAATIQRNGSHLLDLLNDLLDLSKIEAGALTLDRVRCEPRQIVAEVVELLRPRADEKGLRLEFECGPELPAWVEGDPLRLRQVALNLLGNAVKFTERGRVHAQLRLLGEDSLRTLRLVVRDSGIGMTAAQLSRLYRPFTQADMSTSRKFGGTGLGLAITKRLLDLMRGAIEAQSEPGVGTTFTVHVPLLAAPAEPPPPAPPPSTARPAPPPAASDLAGTRLLLADDGPDNRRLVAFLLGRAGAAVELAEDGRQAVDAVQAAHDAGRPFDLVLMDIQMPELDGCDATRELRRRGFTLPVIALTAHTMQGDRERCLLAGCDDYVPKPIERAALFAALQRALSSAPAAV